MIAIGALAYRTIIGPQALTGGALAAFPSSAGAFFHELAASTRSTILGGVQPASPALAGLGALSWASLGSPAVAQKLLLCALPPVAAITLYRCLVRQTTQPAAAILGALGYAMSAVMLWSFSEGRIALLVVMATLPAVWDRLDAAFSKAGPPVPMPRFVVGLGVAVAIGVAFEPGVLLGIGVVAAAQLLGGRRRGRGLTLAIGGGMAAAALVFPMTEDLIRAPAAGLSSSVGRTDVWAILRLAPGGGPGTWAIAAFLPIAAVLCFAIVGREHRLRAWRAVLVVLAGLVLAWASAARYLPEMFSNTTVYVVVAALGEAAIVAYGVASLATGVAQERFGFRQIAAGVLAIVMSVGLGAQALELALAEWEVGPNGLPPAWPVVDSSAPGEFKICGSAGSMASASPPRRSIHKGSSKRGPPRCGIDHRPRGHRRARYREGSHGPGYDYLRRALQELLSGSTSNAGALLGTPRHPVRRREGGRSPTPGRGAAGRAARHGPRAGGRSHDLSERPGAAGRIGGHVTRLLARRAVDRLAADLDHRRHRGWPNSGNGERLVGLLRGRLRVRGPAVRLRLARSSGRIADRGGRSEHSVGRWGSRPAPEAQLLEEAQQVPRRSP